MNLAVKKRTGENIVQVSERVDKVMDAAAAVRFSFLSVAFWWGLFTLFTIAWVPEDKSAARVKKGDGFVAAGIKQLMNTFQKIRHLKTVFLFLLAYWCYIDGVDTIVRMAVDYGRSLGFARRDLIAALLLVQFVGFPAAWGFGCLGQRVGPRR